MSRPSALAPFRHKAFRTLWAATLVSNFGGLVQAVGAAWMMTQLTDSATLVALVQASNTLPVMLFALLSGALIVAIAEIGKRLPEIMTHAPDMPRLVHAWLSQQVEGRHRDA